MVNNIPEIIIKILRIGDLTPSRNAAHLIGHIHSADNGSDHARKTKLFANQIHHRNIEYAYQDLHCRILGQLHEPEQQERHRKRYRQRPQNLLKHNEQEIALAVLANYAFYKYEQRNSRAVIEKGFAFDDRCNVF